MDDSQPPVNEAVALLYRFNKDALEVLRAEATEGAQPLLEPGGVLGEDLVSYLDVRAKVQAAALRVVAQTASSAIHALRDRIRTASRVEFIAELLTLISASGVILSLAKEWKTLGIALGIVTLASSVLRLVSKHLLKTTVGSDGNLVKMQSDLWSVRSRAQARLSELEAFASNQADYSDKIIRSVIRDANVICSEGGKLFALLPYVDLKGSL